MKDTECLEQESCWKPTAALKTKPGSGFQKGTKYVYIYSWSLICWTHPQNNCWLIFILCLAEREKIIGDMVHFHWWEYLCHLAVLEGHYELVVLGLQYHIKINFNCENLLYKIGICYVYPFCLECTWQRISSLRSTKTTNKKKNIRIESEPNLRICMDTKLSIPRISKTYVSVASWAALFTRFWSLIIPISSVSSRTAATRGYLLLYPRAYWETKLNKLQGGLT